MDESPLEPIRNLKAQLEARTREMGMEMVGYSVVPSMDGIGPDMIQFVFALKPDSLLTPEERKAKLDKNQLDAEFEALMSGVAESIASDNESEKIEEAKQGTMDLLKDFLDDK